MPLGSLPSTPPSRTLLARLPHCYLDSKPGSPHSTQHAPSHHIIVATPDAPGPAASHIGASAESGTRRHLAWQASPVEMSS